MYKRVKEIAFRIRQELHTLLGNANVAMQFYGMEIISTKTKNFAIFLPFR